jgi:hypothetical protein
MSQLDSTLRRSTMRCISAFFAALFVVSLGLPSTAAAEDSLVQTLVSKLGVTDKQASGGAGALLGYAKQKLVPGDFAKVSSALPETETLLKAAPKTDSALGGLGGALGGAAGDAAGLASVAGSFKKLGLSSDMVGKFVPVVTGYVQGKGKAGETAAGLLSSVLSPSDKDKEKTTAAAPAEAPKAAEPQSK